MPHQGKGNLFYFVLPNNISISVSVRSTDIFFITVNLDNTDSRTKSSTTLRNMAFIYLLGMAAVLISFCSISISINPGKFSLINKF